MKTEPTSPLDDSSASDVGSQIAELSVSPESAQMLEELRKSEEKYRLLVEYAPVCIKELDLEGRVTSMNQAGLDMLDMDWTAVCGQVMARFVSSEDQKRIHQLFLDALDGKPSFFEFRAETANGPAHFDSCFIPIENEVGEVTRLMGITQDITERDRMQEEIRRSHNLKSLGVLAGGIAHDFNNLLTGVLGNLSLLEDLVASDPEARQLLEEASAAAQRTQSLTQQLLTFAKGGDPIKSVIDVEVLLREVAALCLRGRTCCAHFDIQEDLPALECDAGQISQVIQNLVLNAAYASPEGCSIHLGARVVETGSGRRSSLPLAPGRYLAISVRDEGEGIDRAHLDQIFTPYFTTKEGGHGLGLSIVHSIVTRHGGHVTVDSEPGKGTRFEFYLPCCDSPPRSEDLADNEDEFAPACAGGRVLLLDDEPAARKTVGKMLERLGFEHVAVSRGEDAERQYREAMEQDEPFDVVLFDLTIVGGRGGRETLARIREFDPGVRAIVSSGYSNDPALAEPDSFGFADRLPKPVTLSALDEVLGRVLPKSN